MTRLAQFSAEWPAISALLDEALNLPASEHATWLAALEGERALHREALRTLLAHRPQVETDDFLADLPRLDLEAASAPGGLASGQHVGAYRLIEVIGRGGMGTVWLAERSDGLMKRRVALKLPRVAWGDTFAERLARERDILSTLEHEHIARLYDAGVDTQGRPFLAMEYIDGEPLDAYCRARALSVRERIVLLLQVTTAVAHAHVRLVVHRDLKPGNILVTKDARVHLLDFGVAKLLEGDRTRETALTELAGRALTLDYASPEQIRGEPLGTASDVYSLAVVAYELLSGSRPYRLKRASAAELEEAIAGIEPARASDSAADARVARELRGDLDSILNKALKKNATERYPTMDAFAHDLQCYLEGTPVQARPDSLAYRSAKFVRRHRVQVAAGALVALALVAGTSIALWQAHEASLAAARARSEAARAQVEAATAKAVQGFIESVFNANSVYQADPKAAAATPASVLLDRGAERIDQELASEPEAQLRLYGVLAQMYSGMKLNERSLALHRRELELATRLHGEQSDVALNAAANIGQSLDELGRRDEALAAMLKVDATARSRGPERDRDALRMNIDGNLAHLYYRTDLPKGLARARSAAAIARAAGPTLDGVNALSVLGDLARKARELEEARQALAESVAWVEKLGVTGVLPNILGSLGDVQDELGQIEEAGATMARSIALAERLGDAFSLHIARYKLARYQYDNRLLREAIASGGAELAWVRATRDDPVVLDLRVLILANQGRSLAAYGDAAQGLALLDEARALLPQQPSDRLGQILAARADALISLGRLAEADADLQRAGAATVNGGPRIAAIVRAVRRHYLAAAGRADDALRSLLDDPLPAGNASTAVMRVRRDAEHATLLLATGDIAAARTLAAAALATIEQLPQRRFVRDAEARVTAVLGESLLRENRAADALPLLQRSLALHVDQYDPVHSTAVADARRALATAQRALGARAQAAA